MHASRCAPKHNGRQALDNVDKIMLEPRKRKRSRKKRQSRKRKKRRGRRWCVRILGTPKGPYTSAAIPSGNTYTIFKPAVYKVIKSLGIYATKRQLRNLLSYLLVNTLQTEKHFADFVAILKILWCRGYNVTFVKRCPVVENIPKLLMTL